MKNLLRFLCLTLLFILFTGCQTSFHAPSSQPKNAVNATEYGLSAENSGEQNSKALQALINSLSVEGGTVYIPAGTYLFAANGTQTIGSHCIKMLSNVNIIGDGETTVLMPVGNSLYGLDMFYFNDYLDTGNAVYLENCRFESFTIDAIETSCTYYTSAGKGFMFNLFKNCHWQKVTVKNTDATGFGVDCPIDSTLSDCKAISCGKAATEESTGASGFGIGFGYNENESLKIKNCQATGNKKFGFFFEHQGRFNDEKYSAVPKDFFLVTDCEAEGNLFGFGGVCASNTVYENCRSQESLRCGFIFKDSKNSKAIGCISKNDGEAAFTIQQNIGNDHFEVSDIAYLRCTCKNAVFGVRIVSENPSAFMGKNIVDGCTFEQVQYSVHTEGTMQSLTLSENTADTDKTSFHAEIQDFRNIGNSWNDPGPIPTTTKK